MSRIGKKVIVLPQGVTIDIKGSAVKVKGPKGELSRTFSPVITIEQKDGEVHCVRPSEERQVKALHGTTRAVLNNMVVGVSSTTWWSVSAPASRKPCRSKAWVTAPR